MKQENKIYKCAIYTRKSSEDGLEQEFNSLDAQRESATNYINSQKNEGWELLPDHYDDGGISGGTMDRPGLQQLLLDVKNNKIDIVVVYKVDRLSRSLADFAQMIELFDNHNVSFVSVTQQFNTTSSMGRLTLNILLSFAQFEREVTGERIRDKIALSKKKGLWMGGHVPLGYDIDNKKLIPNIEESELINYIFKRFIKLKSMSKLCKELNKLGYTTKSKLDRNGNQRGGMPFSKTSLYKILNNRIYIGEIRHKNKWYIGEHERILDQEIFESAREIIESNTAKKSGTKKKRTPSVLKGLLYGPDNKAMTTTYTKKDGKEYRYYITHTANKRLPEDCPIRMIKTSEIEGIIFDQLQIIFKNEAVISNVLKQSLSKNKDITEDYIRTSLNNLISIWDVLYHKEHVNILNNFIKKITVKDNGIHILINVHGITSFIMNLKSAYHKIDSNEYIQTGKYIEKPVVNFNKDSSLVEIFIPMSMTNKSGKKMIIAPNGLPINQDRNRESDSVLFNALMKSYKWNDWLDNGVYDTVKELANSVGINSPSYASRILRLITLAPDIQRKIIHSTYPPHLTLADFMDPFPLVWSEQRKHFNIPE